MRIQWFMVLLPVVFVASQGTDVRAQAVTYCDSYSGPFSAFSLTVPRYDLTNYALTRAEVVLDVTYAGQLVGENLSPVQPCEWVFGLDLRVRSRDLTGTDFAFSEHLEASGALGVAGGAEPYTVTLPFAGTIADGEMLAWNSLPSFYADQTLAFTTPGFGGVYFMYGQGVFGWSFTVSAQVCVTYVYDGAIAETATSFGALKARYR